MKKRLKLLLFALTLLVVVTGCNNNTPTTEDEFTVGYIYINKPEVSAWTRAHDEARKYVEQELNITTIFITDVPEDASSKDRMRELIDQGCDVIVATSYGYMDYVEEVAAESPDISFLHTGGFKTSDNMGNYFGKMVNARYVAGAVAAQAYKRMHPTETVKIGYVVAFEYPELIRGIDAFTLGAQSIDPDATTEVKRTDSWFDPAKETVVANALIANGANILTQHLDSSATQAAAEANEGVYAVGYNSDMLEYAPNSNITSAIWNWGPYLKKQIEAIQQETWTASGFYGYQDEIVKVAPLNPKTTDATDQQLVDDLWANMLNGFNIFSGDNPHGPIYDNNEIIKINVGEELDDPKIEDIDWLVKGVISGT